MRGLSDRDLGRRFQLDDTAGPARKIDDARSAALIAGVLGGAGFPPPAGATGHAGPTSGAAATAAKGVAIGKLALVASSAVAVALISWATVRTVSAPAVPAKVAVVSPAPVPVVEAAAPAVAESAEPTVPAASDEDDQIELMPNEPARRPHRKRTHRVSSPSTIRATGGRAPMEPVRADQSTDADDPADEPAAPEDLLAQANAARAEHHWREADALYTRVVASARADLAVQAALVASASLHLEHLGDPAGATIRFRSALSSGPRDPLAEDARWGLAESARALGDVAAERRALDEFLVRHPSSARAPRARARRAELGAGP